MSRRTPPEIIANAKDVEHPCLCYVGWDDFTDQSSDPRGELLVERVEGAED